MFGADGPVEPLVEFVLMKRAGCISGELLEQGIAGKRAVDADLIGMFEGGVEEEPVLQDRSAHGASELVPAQ